MKVLQVVFKAFEVVADVAVLVLAVKMIRESEVREKMLKKDGLIFFKCISKAVNNTMTKLSKKFGRVYNCRFRDIKEKISFDWENGMIAVIFSDTKEIIACNGIENSHLMPEIFEKIKDEWVSCYIEKDVLIVQL